MLNSLMASLLSALLRRIDTPMNKCTQQTVKPENLPWNTPAKKCIKVVDYTNCPSSQELDAIENEFKELVDSLDLQECRKLESPSMMN